MKQSGDGRALQMTKPARTAGLVKETDDGDPKRRGDVHIFAFDGALLITDTDHVDDELAELAASAARDTSSLHRVMNATLQIAGNGYQVQLPSATDAGFRTGDTAACTPAPNMLVIATDSTAQLSSDLVTLRREQVANATA